MSDERVLLTSEENPIYHNPNPTEAHAVEFQQRWKGKVLLEFYETGEYKPNLWEHTDQVGKEIARYIVVWDEMLLEPRVFLDGLWTEGSDFDKAADCDAVLAPGTTEEIREAFRAWYIVNPHSNFGRESLDIDRQVPIVPQEKSVDKAREEISTLFDSYFHADGTAK